MLSNFYDLLFQLLIFQKVESFVEPQKWDLGFNLLECNKTADKFCLARKLNGRGGYL